MASIVAWVRGIKASNVLDSAEAKEFYDDEVWLEAENGETLSIKSYEHNGVNAYGARLEIPDAFGRTWRTECVYSHFKTEAFFRVRGQCVATAPEAEVLQPRKPYYITQVIEDDLAASDGIFAVLGSPHFLAGDEISKASSIFSGAATNLLPTLYVSRGKGDRLPIDARVLARKLAGMCHVVVEPNRLFSFELMQQCERRNPYGGAIGLFSPSGREIERVFPSDARHDRNELLTLVVDRTNRFMSGLASSKGWEWQQLQEAQARLLREQSIAQTSEELDDYIEEFDKELKAKDERIENLEQLLAIAKFERDTSTVNTSDIFPAALVEQLGTELYPGEFSDRLKLFLQLTSELSVDPLDGRTKAVAQQISKTISYSGRAVSLSSQIKTACKDGKTMPQKVGALLGGFGFKRTDGKHIKYQPPKELLGVGPITLPSTPSDSQRGGKNQASDILKNFGLTFLK